MQRLRFSFVILSLQENVRGQRCKPKGLRLEQREEHGQRGVRRQRGQLGALHAFQRIRIQEQQPLRLHQAKPGKHQSSFDMSNESKRAILFF